MYQLSLTIFLFIFCSCTTVHYRSTPNKEVSYGKKPKHSEIDETVGQKQFFLWGNVPNIHVVYVDHEIEDKGYISGANVEIEQYQSFMSFILSVLSFGMYIPIDYKIKFNGMRKEYD